MSRRIDRFPPNDLTTPDVTEKPRIGVVPYLNARPLVAGLDFPLTFAPPAEMAGLLGNNRVDIALVPVAELFSNPDLYAIPGMAIGSKGAVRTVKFLSPTPLRSPAEGHTEEITIHLDAASRTSVLLLKVVLAHQFPGNHCQYLSTSVPDAHRPRLMIGDKALWEEAPFEIDLGEAWERMTGLPFVYACWMTLKPAWPEKIIATLRTTLQTNLAAIDTLASRWGATMPSWPIPLVREYLTQNVRYGLGKKELDGIRTFHRHAKQLGLFDTPFAWKTIDEISDG